LKLVVNLNGESYALELHPNGTRCEYQVQGSDKGSAAVAMAGPGVYSVLLGDRSFTIHVVQSAENLEVWANGQRSFVSVEDARDRSPRTKSGSTSGRLELRAQMPGKIVSLLVKPGAAVHAGQGLMVVEAMKMQNEVKSPKDGVVSRVFAQEGTTVEAGQPLMVVE
jgi:biotin carboxyl carrier protein